MLPDATYVRLETWSFEPAQSAITINLHVRQITARCLLCARRSKRVHSRYERTLVDLPWGEHAVTIRVSVRRLLCDNNKRKRRLFAERLPGMARAGRDRRLPATLASAARPWSRWERFSAAATCGARPFPSARVAATLDTACSTRGITSCSNTGAVAVTTATGCSACCERMAIAAAIPRALPLAPARGASDRAGPQAGQTTAAGAGCSISAGVDLAHCGLVGAAPGREVQRRRSGVAGQSAPARPRTGRGNCTCSGVYRPDPRSRPRPS